MMESALLLSEGCSVADAYTDGRKAGAAALSSNLNPFKPGDERYAAWNRGWREATAEENARRAPPGFARWTANDRLCDAIAIGRQEVLGQR